MNKLLLTFFAGAALCLAADPFVGTWKPNAAKMKMSPGGTPGRETWAYTFEAQGKNQYHVTSTTPDGKTQFDAVWHLDGKAGTPNKNGVTNSGERVGPRHIRTKGASARGAVVADWVVSVDGKTLTETRKGTGTASGRAVDEVYVYDKQPAAAK